MFDRIISGFWYGLGMWFSLVALILSALAINCFVKWLTKDPVKEMNEATAKAVRLMNESNMKWERAVEAEAEKKEALKSTVTEAVKEAMGKL